MISMKIMKSLDGGEVCKYFKIESKRSQDWCGKYLKIAGGTTRMVCKNRLKLSGS